MELKIDVEKVDDVRWRVAVEVPAQAVSSEIERSYGELARSVNIPGFRRGRVPRAILEGMFSDRVRAQVFEGLMQRSFRQAIEEQNLPIIGPPQFETEAASPGEPLRYHAVFEVRPEIRAQTYRGLEAERPILTIEPQQVDEVLQRLRESHAQLHPIEDRDVAQAGDVVSLSYEARVDGKLVGRSEHRDVHLGKHGFPEGFDAAIEGAKVGAERRFSLDYPDDSGATVAGKRVDFVVQMKALSRKELPALDDDFAKTHGDAATLDELTVRIREGLEQEARQRVDESVRAAVLARLIEVNEVPLPQTLVERRVHAMVDEAWDELRQQRRQPRNEAAARQRLHEQFEPRARDQVKLSLLLDAIAAQEKLTVGDDEVLQYIEHIAERAGTAADRVRAMYATDERREQLRGSMLQSRAIDFVVREAQVRDRAPESQIADVEENR